MHNNYTDMYGSVKFVMHILDDPSDVDLPEPVKATKSSRKAKTSFCELKVSHLLYSF